MSDTRCPITTYVVIKEWRDVARGLLNAHSFILCVANSGSYVSTDIVIYFRELYCQLFSKRCVD